MDYKQLYKNNHKCAYRIDLESRYTRTMQVDVALNFMKCAYMDPNCNV